MTVRAVTFDRLAGRIPPSALPEDDPPAEALLVACTDDCMPAGCLETQVRTSRMIVVRNPGNLVPPGGGELERSVERALTRGAVELIVCGHAGCRSIRRLLEGRTALEDLELATWLEHAEGVRLALEGLPIEERVLHAVEANVLLQATHLRTYPAVAASSLLGQVRLHGWVYDPGRDEMLAVDSSTGRFTRRAALDPTQNRLFLPDRLRVGPVRPWPRRDVKSRYLA